MHLSYRTFGHGPSHIVALHGYGRTGADLAVFGDTLGDRFTLHALDLPFHGLSTAPSERADDPFTPAEFREAVSRVMDTAGTERVVLLGYSLGGRVALSLLETMTERVSHAILIAPDGLRPRPWYRRMANSAWGRARYRRFIHHPRHVHTIINLLHNTGILNDKMHRFIMDQTGSLSKRRLLHDVWLSFRGIEPDLCHVGTLLQRNGTRLDLVFGRYDPVIHARDAKPLLECAPKMARTHMVPLGHRLLVPEVAGLVRTLLMDEARK